MLDLENNFPGILGLGFSRKLLAQETSGYISEMRAQGLKDFRIFPAGQRAEFLVITLIEPLDWRNRKVVGYDLYSEPVRRAALDQARDSGHSAITGKITLVQESSNDIQNGFLMVMPIYRNGAPLLTTGQRRRALFGFIHAPFRMNDLMHGILAQDGRKLGLEIFDGTSPTNDNRMYVSEKPAAAAPARVQHSSIFASDLVLRIEEHAWTLRLTSLPAFENTIDRQKAQIVLLSGLLISLLMFMLVRTLAVTRENAIVLAQQMTDALRSSEQLFRSILEHAPIGMALVSLEGRWLEINVALSKIVGYSKQELQNLTFQDITHPDDLTDDLSHVEQLLADAITSYQMHKRYIRKNGDIVWVSLAASLVRNERGAPEYFIAQIEDLTELRAREIRLCDALLEKETLLKEVYHRVKNNLQVITSMFNLQTRILPEGQAREVMAKAAGRVYAMALVHEKLYQSNSLASIGLHDYIRDLCKHFSQATAVDDRGISFQLALEPMEVELETAVPLGLILNELISNSLKHAFNQQPSGALTVTLASGVNGYVVLSVADNGQGMLQKPGNSQPTLGLTLVAALCHQLDAELQSESREGLLTTIRFRPVRQQNRL